MTHLRRRPPPHILYGTPYLAVQRELRRMLREPHTVYVPPPPIDLTDDDRNYRPVYINTKENLP